MRERQAAERGERLRRDARLIEYADDVADYAARVVRNGPEASYAEEKLLFAARRCVRALYLLGQGHDLMEHLAEEMSDEAGRW